MTMPINFRLVERSACSSRVLFRSGQPRGEEWAGLAQMGIRTVLKLNDPQTGDLAAAEAAGIVVIQAHVSDGEAQSRVDPQKLHVIELIIRAISGAGVPLLIHCTEGVDRSGYFAARYRVTNCGWTPQQAWDEWVSLGSHGYRGLVDAWCAGLPPLPVR